MTAYPRFCLAHITAYCTPQTLLAQSGAKRLPGIEPAGGHFHLIISKLNAIYANASKKKVFYLTDFAYSI
jgi:hypothetical protein